ncbi:MAG: hypothetical protein IK085_00225 [Clostridia bacterium]|nr:hypothetical protein [Clostridia bacterium]
MKKALIILTVFILVLAIFTGCGSKIKGTDNVTMAGEGEIPAMTDEEGAVARDENGRMIVPLTGENGEAIKNSEGEVVTTSVEISAATLIGDVVESRFFRVSIPKGWRYSTSYQNVIIDSDDKDSTSKIVISSRSLEEQEGKSEYPGYNLYSFEKGACEITKEETTKLKIAGVDATCERIEVSGAKVNENVSEEQAAQFELRVICFYTFEGPNAVYGVRCESKDPDIANKEFEEVIKTMVLY